MAARTDTSAETAPSPSRRPRKEQIRQLAGIAAVVLFVLFAALNTHTVEIDWIVTTTETRLIVALIVAGVLGAVAGWVLSVARRRRRRR